MARRREARLSRWHIQLLIASGSALWVSGLAWLLLHHYGQAEGEFGPERSPLEPWMMRLHGLALIPVLLGIGGLFIAHIRQGWSHKPQRIPGLALSILLTALVVSGYMLYYVGEEQVRDWTSMIHWSLGLALPAIFLWHYWQGSRTGKRKLSR